MGPRCWSCVLSFILLGAGCSRKDEEERAQDPATRAQRRAKIKQERERRQKPIAELAPTPARAPGALPLSGREGKDAYGYPTRYVDRPALRSLLFRKRYKELTRHFEQFQAEFEADPRKECWLMDASDTFGSAEPILRPMLNAWVDATPNSFAPYLARGSHWVSVGYARRGEKYFRETAEEDLREMGKALDRAMVDLDKALSLRPKLVAAMREKISALAPRGSREQSRRVINQAIAVCPFCFRVRVVYLLMALRPRWGGSYRAMRRFAIDRAEPSNPMMRLLPGYIDHDKASLLRSEKKFDEAMKAIQRACSLGEYWDFLLGRARIKKRAGDVDGAISDLNKAVALRPGMPEILFYRARTFLKAHRWEAAGRDLLAGLRSDPTDSDARRIFGHVVKGLIYDGWAHYKAGRRSDALRVYDLAAELDPLNREVQGRRASIVTGKAGRDPSTMAALEKNARESPDDFRAIQRLDYALARQRRFPRVVELWTEFLKQHPNNGRAYLERGGAYYHMRMWRESHADAKRACDLGVSEGCVRAKSLASRMR